MSRIPGSEGPNPFRLSPRTPGSLGRNDAADPDSPAWLLGDTPGSLGKNDHADPTYVSGQGLSSDDELIYLAGLGPLKGVLRKGPIPPDYPIELGAAKATLDRSGDIAVRICQGLKSDLAYWFARLYYYITLFEIDDRDAFTYPAFVMHFIPVFYDMYATPALQFMASNANKSSPNQPQKPPPSQADVARITEWSGHFDLCRMEATIDKPIYWLAYVVAAAASGVQVHIQSDMATALVRAYRSFSAKYTAVPSFASLRTDFFDNNMPIFKKVRATFLNELLGRCMRINVNPQFASEATEKVNMGLDIPTIYKWRQNAWDQAQKELAKKAGQ